MRLRGVRRVIEDVAVEVRGGVDGGVHTRVSIKHSKIRGGRLLVLKGKRGEGERGQRLKEGR